MNYPNDETLTDFIFDLLEESKKQSVQKAIAEHPETEQRYQTLRAKFSQLNLIEVKQINTEKKTINFHLLLTAAALLAFSFISLNLVNGPSDSSDNSLAMSKQTKDITVQSSYSVSERNLLLSDAETPITEEFDFSLPEIKIEYDFEDYEIVDLKPFEKLQLTANHSPTQIQTNLILISNLQ